VITKPTTRRCRSGENQPALVVSRAFNPDMDLDDLAEVVRRLLASGDAIGVGNGHDPHLLLKRRRVSHVMGAKGAPAT
jgi:hypothetical protein